MNSPILTGLTGLIVTLLYFMLDNKPAEQIWISSEQLERPWSFISAHFVHVSVEHLVWNLVPLLILGTVIEAYSRKRFLMSLYAGVLSVWVYLVLLSPLIGYAGLSGALNTLLVVALYEIQKQRAYRAMAYLTLTFSLLKIVLELVLGNSIFTALVWPPVPQAHLAGWIGGLLIALYFYTFVDNSGENRQQVQRGLI